jgi:hypothetical protein
MRLGVVAAVPLERAWFATGPATTAHRRQGVDHRIEMGDVVDVGGGHLRDERDTTRIGDEMVLGTRLVAIGCGSARVNVQKGGRRRELKAAVAITDTVIAVLT